MTPEQWQQVRDLLHGAVQLSANQRPAYLDTHCAGEPALRREVEQLLAADGNVPTSFLESPAFEQLPPHTETSSSTTVLAAGTKLGPYVMQSLVGAGGMGEVYRARDTRLDAAIRCHRRREHALLSWERLRRLDNSFETLQLTYLLVLFLFSCLRHIK